ncbi:hypothetical protein DM806_24020 [Sphingobium lactosutens]|uniref:hypothetical protein n=1 Tax=Sphingobium lactosutens TaxID=522773 RepID=UPI0015B919D7|nr:hypothetical protein [Sphingobium lactosutens]NWK98673.1 hypothetical protein [Sphingobium lactosutens]
MTIISDDAFVRLVQQRFGLKVNGVADLATIAVLGLAAPAKLPVSDDTFVRMFQGKHDLKIDGWAGRDTIATLDSLRPPAVVKSDAAAIPDRYWPMLSKIESGDRPYIQASTSSASGLYQFIRSTWRGEGGTWGPTLRPAFGGLKPSAGEQLARAKTFTAKNAAYLRTRGVPINRASLYAAHFLGAVTAGSILAADKTVRADLIAGAAATDANPSILRDKTVADFIEWLRRKTGEVAR